MFSSASNNFYVAEMKIRLKWKRETFWWVFPRISISDNLFPYTWKIKWLPPSSQNVMTNTIILVLGAATSSWSNIPLFWKSQKVSWKTFARKINKLSDYKTGFYCRCVSGNIQKFPGQNIFRVYPGVVLFVLNPFLLLIFIISVFLCLDKLM